jgi:hypothetical protein
VYSFSLLEFVLLGVTELSSGVRDSVPVRGRLTAPLADSPVKVEFSVRGVVVACGALTPEVVLRAALTGFNDVSGWVNCVRASVRSVATFAWAGATSAATCAAEIASGEASRPRMLDVTCIGRVMESPRLSVALAMVPETRAGRP